MSRSRCLGRALAACFLVAVVGCGGGAPAVEDVGWKLPPAPPSSTAALSSDQGSSLYGGGCYPAPLIGDALSRQFNQLLTINPHWAPVAPSIDHSHPEADPILVHGVAFGAHGDTGGDFPSDHGFSDATLSLILDDAERGYLGTGNGDKNATLELEWENGRWPAWAWPGDGDRVVALGRWIWDCGHGDPTPGKCSASTAQACIVDADCRPPSCMTCGAMETCSGVHFGYSTEMHPPHATATIRSGRGGTVDGTNAQLAVRADVYVSGDGGTAGDRCAMTHQDLLGDLIFGENCYPLGDPLAQVNAYDFVFDVPLPARPQPTSEPTWRLQAEEPAPTTASDYEVVAHTDDAVPHLTIAIRMAKKNAAGALPTGFAGTFIAGWKSDTAPLTHVRVTLDGLDVKNPVKPSKPVVRDTPGWVMQAQVNGEFQRLKGLDAVKAGDAITQALVWDQWLPPDGKLRFFANGTSRKCIDTLFGKAISTDLHELQLADMVNCLQTTGDPNNPGTVDVTYPGPDFGAGAGTGPSMMSYSTDAKGSDGGTCGPSGVNCLSDHDCDGGTKCVPVGSAFTVRYHIERLP